MNTKTKFKQTEIGMIPEEWDVALFGNVCSIRRGASPRPIQEYFSDKGLPWVKIADATAQNTRFISWTNQFIIEEGRKNTVLVKKGDLIVSNSATPGIPKFMQIEAGIHDGWLLIEPKLNIEKEFIYYVFIFERERLVGIADGSVFRNLKTDIVRNHKIALPPLPEQRAIAKILSDLDSKIELLQEQNKTLEAIGQAIFRHWFVDFEFPDENGKPYKSSGGEMVESELGLIPKGWGVKELSELFKFIKGKKPSEVFAKPRDEYLPQILIETLDGKQPLFAKPENMVVTNETSPIMVMDGASSGRIAIGFSGILGSTLAMLEIDNKNFENLVYYFLKMNEEDIKSNTTGSSIPHTDKNKVYSYNITIPGDLLLVERFQEEASDMIDKIILNNHQLNILRKTRDLLLPKLMTGKIRVEIK